MQIWRYIEIDYGAKSIKLWKRSLEEPKKKKS
jgi:hypothetical protein